MALRTAFALPISSQVTKHRLQEEKEDQNLMSGHTSFLSRISLGYRTPSCASRPRRNRCFIFAISQLESVFKTVKLPRSRRISVCSLAHRHALTFCRGVFGSSFLTTNTIHACTMHGLSQSIIIVRILIWVTSPSFFEGLRYRVLTMVVETTAGRLRERSQ